MDFRIVHLAGFVNMLRNTAPAPILKQRQSWVLYQFGGLEIERRNLAPYDSKKVASLSPDLSSSMTIDRGSPLRMRLVSLFPSVSFSDGQARLSRRVSPYFSA
jgi:hypothetical protein